MTARVEIVNDTAGPALRSAVQSLDGSGRTLLLEDIGEYIVRSTRERAAREISPDGAPWAPLSPRYQRFKQRKRPGVSKLKFDFHMLGDRFFAQVTGGDLQVGSTAPQAAIMHFGGDIKREARSADLYFRRERDGTVGNLFVKRSKSNFAQRVAINAYTITMPARPWLGISAEDQAEIEQIAQDHIAAALSG